MNFYLALAFFLSCTIGFLAWLIIGLRDEIAKQKKELMLLNYEGQKNEARKNASDDSIDSVAERVRSGLGIKGPNETK
jgi:hypothetical protein